MKYFFIAFAAMVIWVGFVVYGLETRPRDERFDGSHLAKICSDGTYIYWYPNLREYRTGGVSALVIDPETVCESWK